MKILSPLLLCLCAVLQASPQVALADDPAPSSPPGAPADGSNGGLTPAEKFQRMKEIFAQLDLTDDQKQQIKQIRQSTTDKTLRRQEIMAVLTPDQKQRFIQLLMQYRNNGGAGGTGAAAATSSFNGGGAGVGTPTPAGAPAAGSAAGGIAGDGSDLAPGAN